jgi:hypothetical protein
LDEETRKKLKEQGIDLENGDDDDEDYDEEYGDEEDYDEEEGR